MPDETRKFGEQDRNRGFESRGRRREVFVFAEVANDIDHADFSDTVTLIGGGFGVVTGPYAEAGVGGGFEGGQGVGHGGGD